MLLPTCFTDTAASSEVWRRTLLSTKDPPLQGAPISNVICLIRWYMEAGVYAVSDLDGRQWEQLGAQVPGLRKSHIRDCSRHSKLQLSLRVGSGGLLDQPLLVGAPWKGEPLEPKCQWKAAFHAICPDTPDKAAALV